MQSMGPMGGNLNRKGPTGLGRAHDSHRILIRGVYAFRHIGGLNAHPRLPCRLSRVIGAELDRRFETKTKSGFGYCGSQKATKTSGPWVASALLYVLSKWAFTIEGCTFCPTKLSMYLHFGSYLTSFFGQEKLPNHFI